MIDTTPTDISPTSRPQASIEAIKASMKATWMDGDYTRFACYMEPGARQILSEWNIAPGERLLDVGCGSGQITIPAAAAGVQVSGVDIAGNLIEDARQRAAPLPRWTRSAGSR